MRREASRLLITGLLGAAASTGFAPTSLPLVTLAALCGLFLAIRGQSISMTLRVAGIFAFASWMIALRWLPAAALVVDPRAGLEGWGALVLLAAIMSIFWAVPFALARYLSNHSPVMQLVLTALLFASGEWARANLPLGFAWNPLGSIWIETAPIVLAATSIGATGLSALTLIAAGSLALVAERPRAGGALLIAAGGLALALGRGQGAEADSDRPVVLVQGNIAQVTKWDEDQLSSQVDTYVKLTEGGSNASKAELIFWPEAAIPFALQESPELRRKVAETLGPGDLLMTGALGASPKGRPTNSVFLIDPQGRIVGRYDKRILVPFGEYIPLEPLVSVLGLSHLAPGENALSPGSRQAAVPLNAGEAGISICFEASFPGFGAGFAARPQYIVNPSNDAWFGIAGPPQNLAQARLRAIEMGLPVIRTTPTGITAIIRADGTIAGQLPRDEPGVLSGTMPMPKPPTPFSRFGNTLPTICLLACLAYSACRRRFSIKRSPLTFRRRRR